MCGFTRAQRKLRTSHVGVRYARRYESNTPSSFAKRLSRNQLRRVLVQGQSTKRVDNGYFRSRHTSLNDPKSRRIVRCGVLVVRGGSSELEGGVWFTAGALDRGVDSKQDTAEIDRPPAWRVRACASTVATERRSKEVLRGGLCPGLAHACGVRGVPGNDRAPEPGAGVVLGIAFIASSHRRAR